MKKAIKVEMGQSYKLGMDEVVGLEMYMRAVFAPISEHITNLAYWTTEDKLVDTVEYKSRDGFFANKDNCGGLEIRIVVPKCEEYDFDFLKFGECDECGKSEYTEGDGQCGYEGVECASQNEGHLDAALRIWFKFEGLEDGTLKFYLYAGGGNGDAPYFRTKAEADLFEASFEAKSLAGIKRAAAPHIKALLKVLGGK